MPHVKKTIHDDSKAVQEVVSTVSYVPPVVGAIIGFTGGGPLGSIFVTSVGMALKRVIDYLVQDYNSRQLSKLQINRINFSLNLLLEEINKEITDNQKTIRGDQLFKFDRDGNITDGQILEVYFNIITQENDECKIRAITYAIKNWLLDESINQNAGHQILKQIQSFSCLQIRIIGLYNYLYQQRVKKIEINGKVFLLKSCTPYNQKGIESDLHLQSFLEEYHYLIDHRILTLLGHFGSPSDNPNDIDLSGYGKKIADMMEVKVIDSNRFKDFIMYLSYDEEDIEKS